MHAKCADLVCDVTVQGVVGTDAGSVWQLNTADPLAEPMRLISGHTAGVTAIAYSPVTDDLVATASADGSLRLWR